MSFMQPPLFTSKLSHAHLALTPVHAANGRWHDMFRSCTMQNTYMLVAIHRNILVSLCMYPFVMKRKNIVWHWIAWLGRKVVWFGMEVGQEILCISCSTSAQCCKFLHCLRIAVLVYSLSRYSENQQRLEL